MEAYFIEANYAKKIGLPDYSSHQFAVILRTELSDLSQLEKTSAELYARLQQSVDSQIVNAGYVPGHILEKALIPTLMFTLSHWQSV